MKIKKASIRRSMVIVSLIPGMLFGAGSLIFPVHLGQLAGSNWLIANSGFLVSEALLPLMALLAISTTRSNGIYNLALPNSRYYTLIFLILVHATLGPLFAAPRTATVPYKIGVAPYLLKSANTWGLLACSAIFFSLVYIFSNYKDKIATLIGKVLNPLFLLLLFPIFLLAFVHPLSSGNAVAITASYARHAFSNGFLQGYNTMDGLAALAFGITIIIAIKELSIRKTRQVSIETTKSGFLGVAGAAIMYLALIWLDATSLHRFKLAANGGITLTQISRYYLGVAGDAVLATLATITCITSTMGLVIAFSQDFHRRFPKIPYRTFLQVSCGLSFLFANLGLDQIIAWSAPVLMFLYPLAITLVILGLLSLIFKHDRLVYQITIALTLIPAFFDMLNALPANLHNSQLLQTLLGSTQQYFPFFSLGFSWLTFSIAGLILGLICHVLKVRRCFGLLSE